MLHAVDDVQSRNAACFAHRHQGAGQSVLTDRVGLHLTTVMNVGDIAQEHGLAVDLLDRKIVQWIEMTSGVLFIATGIIAFSDLHVARLER